MDRQEIITELKQDAPFDLLVVGGGATGCGVAVDAASRGLKVALVEKNDFAEGTSGRSTKLIHGGVRYLEKAVKRLDRQQYNLVKEGLHERSILLKNAPHLTKTISLVTPLYKWLEVPYVYAGLKLYDLLAGKLGIGHSRLLKRDEALKRFPMLRTEGLKAGVLYYDGQFNDARMVVSLALTALEHGAVVANHVEVTGLCKDKGRICGAFVRNRLNGEEWTIRAAGVINATGPFGERLRTMDDPHAEPVIKASSGIHIVLDGRFAPPETGLMIPKTEDGRILFVLPWQGHALIGTTDEPAELDEHPRVTDEEVDYLLRHAGRYFDLQLTRADIKSTWSGLRPLVFDPAAPNTQELVRTHMLIEGKSGLLTVTGGKWTSYRRMAEDTVDRAVTMFGFGEVRRCRTAHLPVAGAAHFDQRGDEHLEKEYGIEPDVARHLHGFYGDRAKRVAELAAEGYDARLTDGYPYLEAEVLHAVREEFAQRAIDLLARRLPLAVVDRAAARKVAPRVIALMAAELGWDTKRRETEETLVKERLEKAL